MNELILVDGLYRRIHSYPPALQKKMPLDEREKKTFFRYFDGTKMVQVDWDDHKRLVEEGVIIQVWPSSGKSVPIADEDSP